MSNFKRRFVKCKNRYHLLTSEDVEYFKKNNKWPDDYEEVDWQKEFSKGTFITVKEFLGKIPTKDQAYNAAFFADKMGVPLFKIDVKGKPYPSVNVYPKYYLQEIFDKL